jgi:hypothetical protein
MANRSRTEIFSQILESAYEIMISAPLEKISFRRLFVVGLLPPYIISLVKPSSSWMVSTGNSSDIANNIPLSIHMTP